MRAASVALLILGFGVGFFAMNRYIAPRAVELSKPIPQFSPQGAAPRPQVDQRTINQLEDALRKDPKNLDALRKLGDIRYDQRNFPEAASLYGRVLELQP